MRLNYGTLAVSFSFDSKLGCEFKQKAFGAIQVWSEASVFLKNKT
jgi:hypothetical protein